MRVIEVSTEVFARIWALRAAGEDTENAVLQRVLWDSDQCADLKGRRANETGVFDERHGVHFPEGFEVFRNYLGNDYDARTSQGAWVLDGKQGRFRTLNSLSRAIGASTKNAWYNWYYRDSSGARRLVSDLRKKSGAEELNRTDEGKSANGTAKDKTRWVDHVIAAFQSIGGAGNLTKHLYPAVNKICCGGGRKLPPSWKSLVRQTIESYSSDSENYRGGADLFMMLGNKGDGNWGLRGYVKGCNDPAANCQSKMAQSHER